MKTLWTRAIDALTWVVLGAVGVLLAVEVYVIPVMEAQAEVARLAAVQQVKVEDAKVLDETESKAAEAIQGLQAAKPYITIDAVDPGGSVSTYYDWWTRVKNSGVQVVIDGACISACTMVLGIVPPNRVCYTPRARFGIHMVTDQDGKPDPAEYEIYKHLFYPPVVIKWIAAHEPITTEVQFMMPEEMEGYIKPCTKEEYPAWSSWLQP